MRTIAVELPDNLDLSEFDGKMILAAKLYEDGKLSSGQAAEMVGLSKRAFMEILGKYGVSVFGVWLHVRRVRKRSGQCLKSSLPTPVAPLNGVSGRRPRIFFGW
jgi:hypothetical protein